MTNFHYDWEFKENGVIIEPISLGMVDDNDRELYLINMHAVNDFKRREVYGTLDQTDLWLRDNVFAHITPADIAAYGYGPESTEAFQIAAAQKVYDFIVDGLSDYNDIPELWGYFAAYDHVCLSQLFGRMIDLPGPMPMFTNELMTIGKRPNGLYKPKPDRPKELTLHNALMDARYQKLVYETWK